MTTDPMTETPPGAAVFGPSAEPFGSCEHPVWVAVADGPASLPAVIEATGAADPVDAVCRLVEASVRAALGAVGYQVDRPRVFELGEAEPDDVIEVRDPARRRWVRGHDGLWFMPATTSPHLAWVELLDRTGDLVEVLPGPVTPTRAEVIERAAEVFCDSSANGARWRDLGEPARALYRRRQAVVADAGLLADPALFAEIARLRAERCGLWASLKRAAQLVDSATATGPYCLSPDETRAVRAVLAGGQLSAPVGFPYRQHPHPFAGSNPDREGVGDPGHCEDCCSVGHVAAHPDLGCGDVGCYRDHGPDAADFADLTASTARVRRG